MEVSGEQEKAQFRPVSAEFIHLLWHVGFGILIFCNEAGMF